MAIVSLHDAVNVSLVYTLICIYAYMNSSTSFDTEVSSMMALQAGD